MLRAGFFNLPSWHEELRKIIKKFGREELLDRPVFQGEAFEPTWKSLEREDFLRSCEVAFHFHEPKLESEKIEYLITSDAEEAIKRIKQGLVAKTGIRGAIGGTFPVLDICSDSNYVAPVKRILAVTDGVCSFIFSEMEKKKISFEEGLRNAQWQGIAPANVIKHIHGKVFQERLALLASKIMKTFIPFEAVYVENLAKVTVEDLFSAEENNLTIRVLGIVDRNENNEIQAVVAPCLIPSRYLIAQIRGGAECCYIQFEDNTTSFYTGQGTSNEVIFRGMLKDLDEITKGNSVSLEYTKISFLPLDKHCGKYCLIFQVIDLVEAISKIAKIFGENEVQITKIIQKEKQSNDYELTIFTKETELGIIKKIIEEIKSKEKLIGIKSFLRYESL